MFDKYDIDIDTTDTDEFDAEDIFSDDDAAEAWAWATDDVAELRLT